MRWSSRCSNEYYEVIPEIRHKNRDDCGCLDVEDSNDEATPSPNWTKARKSTHSVCRRCAYLWRWIVVGEEQEEEDHYRRHPTSRRTAATTTTKAFSAVGIFVLILVSTTTITWHDGHFKLHLPHVFSNDKTKDQKTIVYHETTPTLLSVVDPTTNEYLIALNNPLYDAVMDNVRNDNNIKKKTGVIDDHDIDEYPTLTLDRTHVEYHQSLTVSWTYGSFRSSSTTTTTTTNTTTTTTTSTANNNHHQDSSNPRQSVVTDDSILVLVCSSTDTDNNKHENSVDVVLEAATLAQAKATSIRNVQDDAVLSGTAKDDDDTITAVVSNSWYIARVPILRYPSCRFQLFQSIDNWYLLAESPKFEPIHRPTAIHLAVTNDPTELVVNFVTATNGIPIVSLLDPNNNNELEVYDGTATTYTAEDMCQAPANVPELGKFQSPGYLHTVPLTNLLPDKQYKYRVGIKSGQGTTFSDSVMEFTSSLPSGDGQPFSYLVYGDQGCPSVGWGKGGLWTAGMAAREITMSNNNTNNDNNNNHLRFPIRTIHHFGDLSYARGAAHIWDEWFEMIQVFSSRVPLMISVGNHEYDHTDGGANGKDPSGVMTSHGFMPVWGNFGNDSGGECGIPTSKRFTMPPSSKNDTTASSSSSSNGVFWYSYDYGMVHTIVLSSEHDLSPSSPQHTWLENDLASVHRHKTPWVVVELHRPLYEGEASWDQNAVGIAMRYEFEDLLYSYRVDLVLAGHYHAYHRTCDGLYRSHCHNGGPMHITIGSAGAHLDETYIYDNEWTENYILGEYGYGRITVVNATALHFEFVKAGPENDTAAGDVHDDVWIIRSR